MGELQSNPALFALVKTHAKPITLTSDKIELAFRNDIFIDKIKVKQQTLEETAKKLCGKVPVMIFRKISDEDFKKKITTETPAPQISTTMSSEAIQKTTKPVEEMPSKEELKEIKQEVIELVSELFKDKGFQRTEEGGILVNSYYASIALISKPVIK